MGDLRDGGTARVERFQATNGRTTGAIGLAVVAAVVLIPVLDRGVDYPLWVWPASAGAALLLWAAMLRPAVSVQGERLVLRNMFDTVELPLAAIEQVSVRQFVAVRAGGRRYVGTAVSRSRRQSFRDDRRVGAAPQDLSYGGWVEGRVSELADAARRDRGIRSLSEEQAALAEDVRRQPAWPEIALLACCGLLLALTLLV